MQEGAPLVSVIVAAFNAERFIGHTLESLLRQTYPAFEAIVVDDGSTDRTAELVREFAERDPRIRLYTQPNRGATAARNAAIEKSRGQLIAPLDADDIWHPDKLRKQVDCLLRSGPRTGVVYAWSVYIDEQGEQTGRFCANVEEGNVYLKLLCYNFLGSGSVALIRRSCLQECGGGYREFLAIEDKELLMRIAERYEFAVVPEFLVGYRLLNGSLSHSYIGMVESHRALLNDTREQHPEIPSWVYRWSRGIFYRYAASRSLRCRDLVATVKYLSLALWNDPYVSLLLIRSLWMWRKSRLRAPIDLMEMQTASLSSTDFAAATVGSHAGGEAVGPVRGSGTAPLTPSRRRRLELIEATRRRAAGRPRLPPKPHLVG